MVHMNQTQPCNICKNHLNADNYSLDDVVRNGNFLVARQQIDPRDQKTPHTCWFRIIPNYLYNS